MEFPAELYSGEDVMLALLGLDGVSSMLATVEGVRVVCCA